MTVSRCIVYIHWNIDYNLSSSFLNMNYFIKTNKMHTDGQINFFQMNEYIWIGFRFSLASGTIL